MAHIHAYWYHKTVSRLREFFISKGFLETNPQPRQSYLSVADDIRTMMTYSDGENTFQLPQTAHMWLEFELLKNPELPGVFCCSTSYRKHLNPIPGRHENTFPIFDFEMPGPLHHAMALQKELIAYLGFDISAYQEMAYPEVAQTLGVRRIDAASESRIGQEKSTVFVVTHKPETIHPFWGVRRVNGVAQTANCLLYGMDTLSVSERGHHRERLRNRFYDIDDGLYAQTLFDTFGQQNVERELGEFLSLDLFPRSTGSIGVTRLIRALKQLDNSNRKQMELPLIPETTQTTQEAAG